jgi:hypothetical protein
LKLPEDGLEAAILAAAILVSLLAGWRSVGPGYALPSVFVSLVAFLVVGNVAIPVAIALVGAALVVREALVGPLPLRPAREFAVQVLVVGAGLMLYTAGRYAVQPDASLAIANTGHIVALENQLHSYFEADFQQLLLRWDTLISFANWTYSFAFLAITGAILLWLWAVDTPNYRLFRNSLGISALIAVPTLALFPVAPPRLVPESGLIDTIAVFGREHAFANEYAAVPSLHVGWMALAGFVLGRSVGGRLGWLIALTLGPLMLLDVVATGNHFWIDGFVGVVYCLGVATLLIALEDGSLGRAGQRVWAWGAALGQVGAIAWTTLAENGKARFSFVTLGGLLTYLIVAQYVNPGFTDFWGYLTAQVAIFLVLLLAAEIIFADQGGVSWITHILAVACAFADVQGTDGNLYARIDEYDKLTHFFGVAAITAGLYDCMRGMARKGWLSRNATDRLFLSVAVGIAIGIGWEVYELIGDRVLHTARVAGRWDTSNDIVSDSLGAITVAVLLFLMETRQPDEIPALAERSSESTADAAAGPGDRWRV